MPNRLGIRSVPGLSNNREKKFWAGACDAGDVPNKLDMKVAPSGPSATPAGRRCCMTELRGSASPRIPEN